MVGRRWEGHTERMNSQAAILRATLIVGTLLSCWLGMQAVHELGHVAGAWITGGRVENVALHPLTISRTDVSDNAQPRLVVWAGPLTGTLIPVALWSVAATAKLEEAFLLRFFAGFCLIANGLYIGAGSFDGVGDCGDMLRHGSPIWTLWLFGLLTAPLGLALWHGQAKHFGFGRAAVQPGIRVVGATIAICAALIASGLLVGH